MSINVVSLVGRVGQEPDTKYFESGTVKTRISLAVSRGKNNTDWFTLEAWGKTAEIFQSYVQKGKQIAVTGSLKFDSWNDKNTGVLRTTPIILVNTVELLGGRNDNTGYQNNNSGYSQQYNGNNQRSQTVYQQPQNYPPQQQPQPQQPQNYPYPQNQPTPAGSDYMDHF